MENLKSLYIKFLTEANIAAANIKTCKWLINTKLYLCIRIELYHVKEMITNIEMYCIIAREAISECYKMQDQKCVRSLF